MARYVFVTGGVVSSLGKGLSSASLASLLQLRGFKVRVRKLDPYLNVDPGTMNPFQHGEVFVTDDGAETDLDIGHYERFTGIPATKSDNITTGGIYSDIIKKERRGDYLGGTVQVVPHVTDRIKKFISHNVKNEDFIICEIGGTVGDIESQPFLEAIRQMKIDLQSYQTLYMHLTLLPFLKSAGETKTKPTQRSVKEMLSHGLQPDILVCRSDKPMEEEERKKIALFTNVKPNAVISMPDVDSIYKIPIELNYQKVDEIVLEKFKLNSSKKPNLRDWRKVIKEDLEPKDFVKISMVGKYTELADAYKSLNEALKHGGFKNNLKVDIDYVDSEKLDSKNVHRKLGKSDAILVPGGFGERGIEGMVTAVKYARTKLIPYLGICLGMQIAVIEFARNVARLKLANSTEFDKTTNYPVVGLISEWLDSEGSIKRRDSNSDLGGTMRLGSQECILENNSLTKVLYKKSRIQERHRHRYEVNNNLIDILVSKGLKVVGKSADKMLVEVIEIDEHPWFIGCQFHPEFTSDPRSGHPLFTGFIKAAKKNKISK